MSAFLMVPYADRVELLADGATCLPTGLLIAASDKIVVSPHLPLAVVGRGSIPELKLMTDIVIELTAWGTVDDALRRIATMLESSRPDVGALELAIACVSERDGPLPLMFRTFGDDDWPAWQLRSFVGVPTGGGPALLPEDFAAGSLTAETFRDGAAVGGLAMMQAMRRKPGSIEEVPGSVEEAYWIGCHVDHAVVSASGVTVERIHTWEDQLFRPIQPEGVAEVKDGLGSASAIIADACFASAGSSPMASILASGERLATLTAR